MHRKLTNHLSISLKLVLILPLMSSLGTQSLGFTLIGTLNKCLGGEVTYHLYN